MAIIALHLSRRGPQFLYSLLAAYLSAFRPQLLAARDAPALERFLSTHRPLQVHKLLRRALRLHHATPDYVRVGRAHMLPLPASGAAYPDFTGGALRGSGRNASVPAGRTIPA